MASETSGEESDEPELKFLRARKKTQIPVLEGIPDAYKHDSA